jgi:Uncharacterized conserved protein
LSTAPPTPVVSGGCLCGAVRFTLAPPVAPATRCHCTRCRKRFGGAGSAMSPVSDGQLTWTAGQDALTRYGVRFGLGFCGTCGSTLVAYVGDRVHSRPSARSTTR